MEESNNTVSMFKHEGRGLGDYISENAIAVVGMSCRFAGANTPDEYWTLLAQGKDAIRRYPTDRPFPNLSSERAEAMECGFLNCSVDEFDAKFFGVSPREAKVMDPQQRLLLEVAWEGLEHANINPQTLKNSNTGVFIGLWQQDYEKLLNQGYPVEFMHKCLGNAFSATASRVSYHLGLAGPATAFEMGCSSALYGLHLACEGLRNGTLPLAIVGGVNLILHPIDPYSVTENETMMLSPDYKCKTFDESANGYARGEAISVVVLKRHADAVRDGDIIQALIRGSAVNHDGAANGATSFGTPNAKAQETVYRDALRNSGLTPFQVSYVETHGTGTAVGDPVEISSIAQVYSEGRAEPLIVGSVKTNVGHSEAASGMASLIKVILCMKHGFIPPHLNLEVVNPKLNLAGIPATIPLQLTPWTAATKIAGVSTFSLTGMNVHVLVEEPPKNATSEADIIIKPRDSDQLITLSAKSDKALDALRDNLNVFVKANSSIRLQDVAFTLAIGRANFSHRIALFASSNEELVNKLERQMYVRGKIEKTAPKIGFLFSGQGSQYIGMAKSLYAEHAAFKKSLDQCEVVYRKMLGHSLFAVIWEDEQRLDQTLYGQPAIFCVQYALTQLWKSHGVTPSAVLGHSAGEFAAAVAANLLNLNDGMKLVVGRSKLINGLNPGSMLVFRSNHENMLSLIQNFRQTEAGANAWIDVAAINSPGQTVVSGRPDAIQMFQSFCSQHDLIGKKLGSTHAFHSREMDPILEQYKNVADSIQIEDPTCKYISSSRGCLMAKEDFGPNYWAAHLRDPVQFSKAISLIIEDCHVLIEIGSQPVLLGITLNNVPEAEQDLLTMAPTIRRNEDNMTTVLSSIAKLYTSGASVNIPSVVNAGSRKIILPHYPFQREKYWFEPADMKVPLRNYNPGSRGTEHPLLGRLQPSPCPEQIFTQEYSLNTLPYVAEHKVAGQIIAPAAIFIEAFLAAVRESVYSRNAGIPIIIESIKIENALEMAQPCQMQTMLRPTATSSTGIEYKLTSYRQVAHKWQLHAYASFNPASSVHELLPINLNTLKSGMTELSHADVYEVISKYGLEFGPIFRTIRTAWSGQNRVMTKLSLPDDAATHICHPVLLDAIIQSFALRQVLTTERKSKGIYLLIGIRKFSWTGRNLTEELFANVSGVVDDVDIYNSDGRLVCRVEGVEIIRSTEASFLRALRSSNSVEVDEYVEVWHPRATRAALSPITQFHSPGATTTYVSGLLEDFSNFEAEQGWIFPKINELYVTFLVKTLQELKWTPNWIVGDIFNLETLKSRLPSTLDPRIITAYVQALTQSGYLSIDSVILNSLPTITACQDEIRKFKESFKPFVNRNADIQLAYKFGDFLPRILTGTATGLNFFFPEDTQEFGAVRYYRESESFLLSSELTVAQVLDTVAGVQTVGTVRILEIGAGSGVTANSITSKLQELNIPYEYTFTDISSYFVNAAKQKFGSTLASYEIFNLEMDPLSQGLSPNTYDIVTGVDVLHATQDVAESLRNVSQVLRPGGRLVFTEMVKSEPSNEFTWGMLEGWWRFNDFRTTSPLVSAVNWTSVLESTGFVDVSSVQIQDGLHGSFSATKSKTVANIKTISTLQKKKWLLISDGSETTSTLEQNLRSKGREVVKISLNTAKMVEDSIRLDPDNLDALVEAMRGILADAEGFAYLWTTLELENVAEIQYQVIFPLLQFYKALIAIGKDQLPATLFLVLRGVHVIQDSCPGNPNAAAAWGLIKTIGRSSLELNLRIIDLDPTISSNEPDLLFTQLWSRKHEPFVAIRGDEVFVQRLELKKEPLDSLQLPATPRFNISLVTDSECQLTPCANLELEPISIEIEVRAVCIDSIEESQFFGVSGVVVSIGSQVTKFKVGESVLGLAVSAPIGTHCQIHELFTIRKPEGISFSEAAGIPVAFVSAHIALVEVAKLKPSDRLIIQNATSGIGLAAIQIAKYFGAQILATALSNRQRSHLSEIVGIDHVFGSITEATPNKIMEATKGMGVSVVLCHKTEISNQLLEVCCQGAQVVEFGPSARHKISSARSDIKQDVVDLGSSAATARATAGFSFIQNWIAEKRYKALPNTILPITRLNSVIQNLDDPIGNVCILLPLASNSPDGRLLFKEQLLNKESTYLITGGLGGLGMEVAKWMIQNAAESIILVGRNEPSPQVAEILNKWRSTGLKVRVVNTDISVYENCANIFKIIVEEGLPPLGGIVHAAGVLADGWVEGQSWETMEHVLKPKAYGSWHLHQLTKGMSLQFFVMFSSMSSYFSIPNQSNHAAANRFMDSLAQFRGAMGIPGTSINWGAWSDVGAAANVRIGQEGVAGVRAFTPAQGIRAFEKALSTHVCQTGVIDVSDWNVLKNITRLGPYLDHIKLKEDKMIEEEAEAVRTIQYLQTLSADDLRAEMDQVIRGTLQRTLGLQSNESIDETQQFSDLGVDSLMTMELRNSLQKRLQGLPVSVHSIQENSFLKALVGHLVDKVAGLKIQGS